LASSSEFTPANVAQMIAAPEIGDIVTYRSADGCHTSHIHSINAKRSSMHRHSFIKCDLGCITRSTKGPRTALILATCVLEIIALIAA